MSKNNYIIKGVITEILFVGVFTTILLLLTIFI